MTNHVSLYLELITDFCPCSDNVAVRETWIWTSKPRFEYLSLLFHLPCEEILLSYQVLFWKWVLLVVWIDLRKIHRCAGSGFDDRLLAVHASVLRVQNNKRRSYSARLRRRREDVQWGRLITPTDIRSTQMSNHRSKVHVGVSLAKVLQNIRPDSDAKLPVINKKTWGSGFWFDCTDHGQLHACFLHLEVEPKFSTRTHARFGWQRRQGASHTFPPNETCVFVSLWVRVLAKDTIQKRFGFSPESIPSD